MIINIESVFNIEELIKYLINDISGNIFLKGVYSDIDNIQNELNLCSNFMETLAIKLSGMIDDTKQKNKEMIKVESNDREGHYLTLTKRRAELLQKVLAKDEKMDIDINKLIFNKLITKNEDICIIGYGQSGSGKTSSLIYLVPHLCFDLDHIIDFEFLNFLIKNKKLEIKI